jgi:hypothetical protein
VLVLPVGEVVGADVADEVRYLLPDLGSDVFVLPFEREASRRDRAGHINRLQRTHWASEI